MIHRIMNPTFSSSQDVQKFAVYLRSNYDFGEDPFPEVDKEIRDALEEFLAEHGETGETGEVSDPLELANTFINEHELTSLASEGIAEPLPDTLGPVTLAVGIGTALWLIAQIELDASYDSETGRLKVKLKKRAAPAKSLIDVVKEILALFG